MKKILFLFSGLFIVNNSFCVKHPVKHIATKRGSMKRFTDSHKIDSLITGFKNLGLNFKPKHTKIAAMVSLIEKEEKSKKHQK